MPDYLKLGDEPLFPFQEKEEFESDKYYFYNGLGKRAKAKVTTKQKPKPVARRIASPSAVLQRAKTAKAAAPYKPKIKKTVAQVAAERARVPIKPKIPIKKPAAVQSKSYSGKVKSTYISKLNAQTFPKEKKAAFEALLKQGKTPATAYALVVSGVKPIAKVTKSPVQPKLTDAEKVSINRLATQLKITTQKAYEIIKSRKVTAVQKGVVKPKPATSIAQKNYLDKIKKYGTAVQQANYDAMVKQGKSPATAYALAISNIPAKTVAKLPSVTAQERQNIQKTMRKQAAIRQAQIKSAIKKPVIQIETIIKDPKTRKIQKKIIAFKAGTSEQMDKLNQKVNQQIKYSLAPNEQIIYEKELASGKSQSVAYKTASGGTEIPQAIMSYAGSMFSAMIPAQDQLKLKQQTLQQKALVEETVKNTTIARQAASYVAAQAKLAYDAMSPEERAIMAARDKDLNAAQKAKKKKWYQKFWDGVEKTTKPFLKPIGDITEAVTGTRITTPKGLVGAVLSAGLITNPAIAGLLGGAAPSFPSTGEEAVMTAAGEIFTGEQEGAYSPPEGYIPPSAPMVSTTPMISAPSFRGGGAPITVSTPSGVTMTIPTSGEYIPPTIPEAPPEIPSTQATLEATQYRANLQDLGAYANVGVMYEQMLQEGVLPLDAYNASLQEYKNQLQVQLSTGQVPPVQQPAVIAPPAPYEITQQPSYGEEIVYEKEPTEPIEYGVVMPEVPSEEYIPTEEYAEPEYETQPEEEYVPTEEYTEPEYVPSTETPEVETSVEETPVYEAEVPVEEEYIDPTEPEVEYEDVETPETAVEEYSPPETYEETMEEFPTLLESGILSSQAGMDLNEYVPGIDMNLAYEDFPDDFSETVDVNKDVLELFGRDFIDEATKRQFDEEITE